MTNKVCALNIIVFALATVLIPAKSVSVQPNDYPHSLERELNVLLKVHAQNSSDPGLLLKLADVYLDIGNDLYTDVQQRIEAYEKGARFAQRALQLQEANAVAHYLYAANLGEAADLKGMAASLRSLEDIRVHVRRALELQNDHIPTLIMAGMLLEDLPRFMGGNPEAAIGYLQRAVSLDPTYTEARLKLAQMYLKRKNPDLAKQELLAIVNMEHPEDPYAWAKHHRPEAQRLLEGFRKTP